MEALMIDPYISYDFYVGSFKKTKDYHELWMAGLCQVKIGDYRKAHDLFISAIEVNLKSHQTTRHSFPWDAIYLYSLTGDFRYLSTLISQLYTFKEQSMAPFSPAALFCYLFIDQIQPQFPERDNWINKLISYEKRKADDIYPIGYCYKAILENDIPTFEKYIKVLLTKHGKSSKFGQLRETPEGYYCMDATSLLFISINKHKNMDIDDMYLPVKYLQWLCEVKRIVTK
jgi:hypothetical protein